MEEHQQRNGLTFTKAMVFPQGRFSAPAMLSLKCNGYMAAVNTEVIATPLDVLRIADLLDVAITSYHGFPLYRRRYPERLGEFPFMMFLGQPLLLVEHHGFFKGGFARLESLMDGINRLPVKPSWKSLADVLQETYKVRRNSSTEFHCRLFSTRQTVHNYENRSMDFVLSRFESNPELIDELQVDGVPVEFATGGDAISTTVTIPPTQCVKVEYVYRNPLPLASAPGIEARCAVRLRRYLSEFRDNVIAQNDTVLAAASAVKKKLFSRAHAADSQI
jgi:hypothetical protein